MSSTHRTYYDDPGSDYRWLVMVDDDEDRLTHICIRHLDDRVRVLWFGPQWSIEYVWSPRRPGKIDIMYEPGWSLIDKLKNEPIDETLHAGTWFFV